MAIDAVFPAASELVMLYAGAVAAGAFASQRVTPLARSFVSIPAGVFRMPLGRYTVLTAVGSAVWCFAFAGAGWALGSSWDRFHHDFRFVDYAVGAAVVGLVVWLVLRRRSSK